MKNEFGYYRLGKKMNKIKNKDATNAVLGSYIVAFQSLEHELICLFSCLNDKNNPNIGEIISSKLPFNNLLDVLDGIFRYRVKDDDLINKFSEIMRKSELFQKERNNYVHSYYDTDFFSSDSASLHNKKIRRGKGYISIVKTYDPDQLEVSSSEIYDLIVKIIDFATELQNKNYITNVYSHLT
ncbi:MAG: hypothetical protein V1933_01590 [Candidatus Omnitrophota bacterium]